MRRRARARTRVCTVERKEKIMNARTAQVTAQKRVGTDAGPCQRRQTVKG